MNIAVATSNLPGAKPASAKAEQTPFYKAVAELRALCAADLELVNSEILSRMHSSVPLIPELAGHLISAGGKRVRPMLTLATASALKYSGPHHVHLAAAVELIHGATLLHDDVVDESQLRRGLETANAVWGNKESVLVGDFLFSRAFELMVVAQNLPVLKVLSNASSVIAEGEVLQLATQKNLDTTFEMYLEVVGAKTAALFAAASEAGALIAGADDHAVAQMKDFGMNLGIAYQLVDDALDYAGFEENLGKSVGDDFREGKMTLPVVYAVERARDGETEFWQRVLGGGAQNDGDFERAVELMLRDHTIKDTMHQAQAYAARAVRNLDVLPDGDHKDALAKFVQASIERDS